MALHIPSALLALGLAGLVAFLSSQASPPPALLNPASIRVEYMPHPRDMVQIKEGTPYVVPTGKLFVLTGLGSTSTQSPAVTLFVDGVQTCSVLVQVTSVTPVPAGLSIGGGASMTVNNGGAGGTDDSRAWGYLASQ